MNENIKFSQIPFYSLLSSNSSSIVHNYSLICKINFLLFNTEYEATES